MSGVLLAAEGFMGVGQRESEREFFGLKKNWPNIFFWQALHHDV